MNLPTSENVLMNHACLPRAGRPRRPGDAAMIRPALGIGALGMGTARLSNALGAFDTDRTVCRAGFRAATGDTGVPYQAWVAALINHSSGGSAQR